MYKSQNSHQIIPLMNRNYFIVIFIFFISFNVSANENNFYELGKKSFDLNQLDKSKIYFEKDIVRNTKSVQSYLYLAKIYKTKKQNDEFEKNLNTALLLEPKNEEALYLLIVKKINDGDYNLAKKKLDIFNSSCNKMCKKKSELIELINKFKS